MPLNLNPVDYPCDVNRDINPDLEEGGLWCVDIGWDWLGGVDIFGEVSNRLRHVIFW